MHIICCLCGFRFSQEFSTFLYQINNQIIDNVEKSRLYYALFFPVLISLFIFPVLIFKRVMGSDFHTAGMFPFDLKPLPTVLTIPFIHSDLSLYIRHYIRTITYI